MTLPPDCTNESAYNCGSRLRELRERKGWEITALARRLALSVDQLKQLEQDESSLFYSQAIRFATARKVAEFLGEPILLPLDKAPEPEASLTEAFALETPQPLSSIRQVAKADEVQKPEPRFSFHLSKWSAAFIAVTSSFLLLLMLPKNAPVSSAQITQPALSSDTPQPSRLETPDSTELTSRASAANPATVTSVSDSPPASPPAGKVSQVANDVALACQAQTGPIDTFMPSKAVKDPALVFVKGAPGQVVCVKDSRGKEWQHTFSGVDGQSFYGTAPWLIASGQLQELEIYFQGARARSKSGGNQLRLLPANPA